MYFYHGYALGIASTVKGKEFTEACCGLSVRGGVAAAESNNFNANGIKFKSVKSKVSGQEREVNGLDVYTTAASVEITKLDILGKFTADSIEAHIVAQHRAGDYEPSTVITGSKFVNLKIKGTPANPTLSPKLSDRYPTFGSMKTDFQNPFSREWVLKCLVGYGLPYDARHPEHLQDIYYFFKEQEALPKLKQTVLCSFVRKVNIGGGGAQAWGPIIMVPGFGTIYLGEVMMWPWMRCLNMFRIELASGGCISGGSAGTNGTGFPPGYTPPGNGP